MRIEKDFDKIISRAHMWNWAPDWGVVEEVYKSFPQSYSVLTPFAYSYLEELIRSTTSEYGKELIDENGNQKPYRKVGIKLIELAQDENPRKKRYVALLEQAKDYFAKSTPYDKGDNRNSVNHGYMHSRYWSKESFEELIHFIAILSQYSRF